MTKVDVIVFGGVFLLACVLMLAGAMLQRQVLSDEISLYKQAQELKQECEQDLPRNEFCTMIYVEHKEE